MAVKVLSGESTTDTFRRATREMQAFAAVRSPYLVTLYDAGQHDGVFYYSMEYLPGGSLAAADRPLSVSDGAARRWRTRPGRSPPCTGPGWCTGT